MAVNCDFVAHLTDGTVMVGLVLGHLALRESPARAWLPPLDQEDLNAPCTALSFFVEPLGQTIVKEQVEAEVPDLLHAWVEDNGSHGWHCGLVCIEA